MKQTLVYLKDTIELFNDGYYAKRSVSRFLKKLLNNKIKGRSMNNIIVNTKEELIDLIKKEMQLHGNNVDLNYLDISNVTDLSYLFYNSEFNGNISNWNVLHVKEMEYMFSNSKFNGDISHWNVSQVINMRAMFYGSQFNQDISQWDTSNVKNMAGLFYESSFNQNISKWNVSVVENMKSMFYGSKFNGDLSSWDTSNVVNMSYMFYDSKFNQDISKWNISNVVDMSYMFHTSEFNQDLTIWKPIRLKHSLDVFNNSICQLPYWANYETNQEIRNQIEINQIKKDKLIMEDALNQNNERIIFQKEKFKIKL